MGNHSFHAARQGVFLLAVHILAFGIVRLFYLLTFGIVRLFYFLAFGIVRLFYFLASMLALLVIAFIMLFIAHMIAGSNYMLASLALVWRFHQALHRQQ